MPILHLFPSRLRRFSTAAIAAGLLGFLVTGCQSSLVLDDQLFGYSLDQQRDNPQSPDRQPSSQGGLKLGAILPATGDLGEMGRPMLQALPLLVDTVNRCGGVNHAFVSLVVEDQPDKPADGVATVNKLADGDRVGAVIGAFSSNISAAALPTAVQDKVLLISPASTSATLTDRAQQGSDQGFWARTVPSETQEAIALAQLAQKRGFRNVITLSVNNPDAIALEQAFVAAFEKRGGTVIGKAQPLRYDLNADSFTLEELAYGAFRPYDPPDAVIAILDRTVGASLLKFAAEQRLTQRVPIVLTDEVRTDAFVQRVGKASNGTALLSEAIGIVPAADGPGFADLTDHWQEQFGTAPGPFVAQTWDAAALVLLAAEAAKANSREGIEAQLRNVANPPGVMVSDVCEGLAMLKQGQEINYDGASGKVDLDRFGDVKADYDIWQVDEQGQFKRVDRIRPDT